MRHSISPCMVAGIKELLCLSISKDAKVDVISNCGKEDSVRISLKIDANVSKFLFQFGTTINYNLFVVG